MEDVLMYHHHQSMTNDTTGETRSTSIVPGFQNVHERTSFSLNTSTPSHTDEELWEEDTEDVKLDAGARFTIVDNLKVFNSAIHTMSRFSDLLHFEPTTTGLRVMAITNSQSAFAAIDFKHDFFAEIDVSQVELGEYNICRVSMNGALACFNAFARSTPFAYRLQIDPRADVMVVQARLAYSISRNTVLNLRECASSYRHLYSNKAQLENRITVSAAVLLSLLPQIGSDADELRLIADRDNLTIERYLRETDDHNSFRKTQATVDVRTLDHYSIPKPGHVCICLKEFKSILHFANQSELSVSIHFDMPGKPVVVALEENIDFEAEFTLGSHSLPSHEFDRLMAAQRRVTTSTTLRPNTTRSTEPTVENAREMSEPIAVNASPAEVCVDDVLMDTPTPPQVDVNQTVGERDQEMEDMDLGESASVMMASSVVRQGVAGMDEWEKTSTSDTLRLSGLPRRSQLEGFQRQFLALSQVTMSTTEQQPMQQDGADATGPAHAQFLQREILDYDSDEGEGDKTKDGDDKGGDDKGGDDTSDSFFRE